MAACEELMRESGGQTDGRTDGRQCGPPAK